MDNNKVAIHYAAATNRWIDFFVIVDMEKEDAAESAVKRAVDAYWNSDDQCYGDVVMDELNKIGVEYQLKVCEYDSSDDEPTAAWTAYCNGIYKIMPVIEISD